MKLKPLGKKLATYWQLLIASAVAIPICLHFGWDEVGGVSTILLTFSLFRIIGISIDGNCNQYGLFGFRQGPDPFVEYEPGDPEYENERIWQERD